MPRSPCGWRRGAPWRCCPGPAAAAEAIAPCADATDAPSADGRRGETGHRAQLDDAEGQHPAVGLAHRNIFAGTKDVLGETRNRLVVHGPDAVGERPAIGADPHQLPNLVAFALPETMHGADFGNALEGGEVEAPLVIVRQGEDIDVARAAGRGFP